MSAETDYISYLETKVCDQAWRIGELEAALLLILNDPEGVATYLKASQVLYKGLPSSLEMKTKYKELVNGN